MDIVAATAAESRALADAESMKMAARKINLRITVLYSFAVLTASFVVPMDHPFLNGKASSVSSKSIFIIAVVEAGLPRLAYFLNAAFVFSAFTGSINSLYLASRVMHTLALRGQTGPEFITKRLRQCRSGVPTRAVFASSFMMLLAFLGHEGPPGQVSWAVPTCFRRPEETDILTLGADVIRIAKHLYGDVAGHLCYYLCGIHILL